MQGLAGWSGFPFFAALAWHQLLTCLIKCALRCSAYMCFDSLFIFYLQEQHISSVEHFQWSPTAQEDSTERSAHVEGKETALLQVHTPPPLFFVTSCPLLLFALSPSVLFVQGTYQPEREKRREGGGVSQHVRQERGGKRERIACGGGTQKADCEVGRRLKENSCFFSSGPSHY